jgi:hypothetical protein
MIDKNPTNMTYEQHGFKTILMIIFECLLSKLKARHP